MTDPRDRTIPGLPPELKALDEELLGLRYEERPSFGPELEAELARAWADMPRRAPFVPRRRFAAAAAVALLAVGLGVPQARASLVRLVRTIQNVDTRPSVPLPAEPEGVSVLAVQPPRIELPPDETPAPTRIPPELPPLSTSGESVPTPEATFPELEDRDRVEDLIREHYPMELQREGVGGTVRLLLWVDSTGAVDLVQLRSGSGVAELDWAAAEVAPRFRFVPATRRGEAVGTWVEFDVVFRPNPEEYDPFSLPAVDPVQLPEGSDTWDVSELPAWDDEIVLTAPVQQEAGELLRSAVRSPAALEELGSAESVLQGEPPEGAAPTAWRTRATQLLEDAMVRAPDNPAPLLALARIREKQGLKTEARLLLERGLQRALRGGATVSPTLLAELLYERGMLVRESWLASRDVGRLPAEALSLELCPAARSSGEATTGYASSERLIAWNYLCPGALGEVLANRFEPTDRNAASDLEVMMASFRTAVESDPTHVGANLQVLLALAEEERWTDVLDGARRFVWATQGHPYGLLLSGLALQRLARSEDAEGQFELALRGLPANEVEDIRSVAPLLHGEAETYARLGAEERTSWTREFWAPLDPILTTEVNEREVEHLARAAYAHLRFGSAASDPGRVWVRYGRPDAVRVVREGGGLRTEFWDYGAGPDITFRRMGSSDQRDLTPEARAYLDELLSVFPHRYGTRARTVFTLPAQLSRFLLAEEGVTEAEIFTQVPPLMATGARDTLDVGLFLLDTEGHRVDARARRIPATEAPLAFRVPASGGADGVVVEVFHRRTGQAAALRSSLELAPDAEERADVSDLLLVEAADPDPQAVDRKADWVEPLSPLTPLDDDALGAVFEVYGAHRIGAWYRVRAEVVDRDTGGVLSVPVRPAGEEGFRTTWDRIPSRGGVTKEYLTVALSAVPPGRYTVRVVVDIPGARAPLVARANVDRR